LIPTLFITEHFIYLFKLIYDIATGKWKKDTTSCDVIYRLKINDASK